MPWDRQRLLGQRATMQLELEVADKYISHVTTQAF